MVNASRGTSFATSIRVGASLFPSRVPCPLTILFRPDSSRPSPIGKAQVLFAPLVLFVLGFRYSPSSTTYLSEMSAFRYLLQTASRTPRNTRKHAKWLQLHTLINTRQGSCVMLIALHCYLEASHLHHVERLPNDLSRTCPSQCRSTSPKHAAEQATIAGLQTLPTRYIAGLDSLASP